MNKDLLRHVDLLIKSYCYFDQLSKSYEVNIRSIAEWDMDKVVAMMMADNLDLATEATSIDNPEFEKSMLPALTKYLSRSFSSEIQKEYVAAWKKGIFKYMENRIERLFEERLELYNEEQGRPCAA